MGGSGGRPSGVDTDGWRWQAVLGRDVHQDGVFVYAVTSTGIYCRPSCPSRRPLRVNVEFYADSGSAEYEGFRACRRCCPNGLSAIEVQLARVTAACRRLETSTEPLSTAQLALEVGMSESTLLRAFKRTIGISAADYAAAVREGRVRAALAAGQSVTEAFYNAGYGSSGAFYEKARAVLGMSPTEFRSGGVSQAVRFAVGECSLGAVLVAATDAGVCAIDLGEDPQALLEDFQRRFHRAELVGAEPEFEALVARAVGHVEDPTRPLGIPLDIRGTAFQKRVWKVLRRVPAGTTVTYSQLAKQIGRPSAARAVAKACASNTLAVAIPCHRVIRQDGSLAGYRWGVELKRELLAREGVTKAAADD